MLARGSWLEKAKYGALAVLFVSIDIEPVESPGFGRLAEHRTMPHVIVKLWPGKSDEQKAQPTEAIVRDMKDILRYGDESVSVAFEEVSAGDWDELVFKPDIAAKWDSLTKKPGYGRAPTNKGNI